MRRFIMDKNLHHVVAAGSKIKDCYEAIRAWQDVDNDEASK